RRTNRLGTELTFVSSIPLYVPRKSTLSPIQSARSAAQPQKPPAQPEKAAASQRQPAFASDFGQLPVDLLLACLAEGLVDLGEGFAAEEAVPGGQRRGVGHLDHGVVL